MSDSSLGLSTLLLVAAGIGLTITTRLDHDAALVNLGDPNETVRELMGDPTREGECGSLTVAPKACADEYVYRYVTTPFFAQNIK